MIRYFINGRSVSSTYFTEEPFFAGTYYLESFWFAVFGIFVFNQNYTQSIFKIAKLKQWRNLETLLCKCSQRLFAKFEILLRAKHLTFYKEQFNPSLFVTSFRFALELNFSAPRTKRFLLLYLTIISSVSVKVKYMM